jgi:NTE family protein
MLVLPRDAAMLGIQDPDELEIADAVRMSVSTPIFFEPVLFRHRKTGLHHVVVDGGLLSNYPIWLFDAPADTVPQFPTFGLLLVASGAHAPLTASPGPDAAIRDLASGVEFLKAIVETVAEANDRFYIERSNFARTIAIPTLGVKATQFDITPEQSQELFDAGKAAATSFLATWDFQAYREEFRSARPSATGERGFTGGH